MASDSCGAGPLCTCRRNAASLVTPIGERRLLQRARGAAAWALPSFALALVPKCPLCIAAYLTIGGGLSVSLTTVTQLRTLLMWFCWSVLMLLAVRMSIRFMHRMRIAREHESSSEARKGMTSMPASARFT